MLTELKWFGAAALVVLVSLFPAAAAAHPGPAVQLPEGVEVIRRYANLEQKEIDGSSYRLGDCRRQRSSWTGQVVVWCKITWHYDEPIFGGFAEELGTRIFTFRAQRGCLLVAEAGFAGSRCLLPRQ